MTIEQLQAKLASARRVLQQHLDNANAAQGAIQMLELLIKDEQEQKKGEQ